MQTLQQAIEEYRQRRALNPSSTKQYIADWRDTLPLGSMWTPGSLGKPDCVMCMGIGYVSANAPALHPLFGKLFECECVTEDEAYRRAKRLSANSGLKSNDFGLSWDLSVRPNEDARKAKDAIDKTLARGWGWVYLHGGNGPGKTLMLKTVVAEAVRNGRAAHYARWSDMLQHLRDGYGAGDYDQRMEDLRRIELLAIDEIGRANDTDWVAEAESRILDERYELALVEHNSVTLFASNFGPQSPEISEWLSDRIMDERFAQVHLVGPSMRRMAE